MNYRHIILPINTNYDFLAEVSSDNSCADHSTLDTTYVLHVYSNRWLLLVLFSVHSIGAFGQSEPCCGLDVNVCPVLKGHT